MWDFCKGCKIGCPYEVSAFTNSPMLALESGLNFLRHNLRSQKLEAGSQSKKLGARNLEAGKGAVILTSKTRSQKPGANWKLKAGRRCATGVRTSIF